MLVFSAIIIPCVIDWTPVAGVFAVVWSIGCILGILALRDARRYWWAARSLTALIFLSYVLHVIKMFATTSTSLDPIMGLVVIGGPCLWYTVFGRFSLRTKDLPEEPVMPTDRRMD